MLICFIYIIFLIVFFINLINRKIYLWYKEVNYLFVVVQIVEVVVGVVVVVVVQYCFGLKVDLQVVVVDLMKKVGKMYCL